jgi:hypothetical protein
VKMRTALFVDNNQKIPRSLDRCLRIEPYNKLFANNSRETLDIPQQERVQITVNNIHSSDMEKDGFLRIVGNR